MATRLHSTGQVETTFRLPIGSCRDTHGRILARKLGGRQSVYIAARSACWRQKQASVVPQFESAALDCGVSHGARRAPRQAVDRAGHAGNNLALLGGRLEGRHSWLFADLVFSVRARLAISR